MSTKMRLIDEVCRDIFDDKLGEISCISISRAGLNELKEDYAEEFAAELLESGRKVSEADIKEYLGKSILIEDQDDGKKYNLLRKV